MEVCISPLSAIPPGLVSFDYSMRGERFGYGFTRYFGDQDVDALDSRIRVHVMLLATRGGEALASAVAFSFPLCGATDMDWTVDSAMRFMRAQVLEFSHHLSDIEVTDVLRRFWELAKFQVLAASQGSGERHMLMYMFVETRIRPCYMYIHEDGELQALATAHSLWTLVRGIMVERLSSWRGRSDSDYSPSKPSSKMARLAAVAASMFSH